METLISSLRLLKENLAPMTSSDSSSSLVISWVRLEEWTPSFRSLTLILLSPKIDGSHDLLGVDPTAFPLPSSKLESFFGG